jgi:multiple sugar transport system substrate-binding protein
MRKFAPLLILALLLTACQVDLTSTIPTSTSAPAVPSLTAALPLITPAPSATPTTAITRTPASKINVKVDELRGIKVLFWHPWSGGLAKMVDDLVTEFNQTNIWGITVNASSQGSIFGLDDQLSGGLTGPNPGLPQLIALPSEYISSYQVAASMIADLQPYIQDPQWGLTSVETTDFYPAFWSEETPSGPRFSLPVLRSMAFLLYNMSWGKELGFSQPPSTQADFRTQVCAAAKFNRGSGNVESTGTGGWIISTSSATDYSWFTAAGATLDPGQALPPLFMTSQTAAVFNYLRKLVDDSCAWTSRNPEPYNYFSIRMALVYSATLEDLAQQKTTLTYLKNTDTWTILPYPSGASVQSPLITFGPSLGVLKSSPAQQLASWLFARWLALPRVQARLAAAGGLLPVRKSAIDLMKDYANANPQWAQAAGWLAGQVQPLPVQPWWRVTQPVLEDASSQVFQVFITPEKIPDILMELDATIQELLTKK